MTLFQREPWLKEIGGRDLVLRLELENWLAIAVKDTDEIVLPQEPTEEPDDLTDHVLGVWRLVRELGRGGMGAVWLAENADGAFPILGVISWFGLKWIGGPWSNHGGNIWWISLPQSMVLTENNYMAFLVAVTRDEGREADHIPGRVRQALVNSPLMLMGFDPESWDFRVLLWGLLESRPMKQTSVTVLQIGGGPEKDQLSWASGEKLEALAALKPTALLVRRPMTRPAAGFVSLRPGGALREDNRSMETKIANLSEATGHPRLHPCTPIAGPDGVSMAETRTALNHAEFPFRRGFATLFRPTVPGLVPIRRFPCG